MGLGLRAKVVTALDRSGALRSIGTLGRRYGAPRLTIVTYHRIADLRDTTAPLLASEVIDASVDDFEAHVAELARDYDVITTAELDHGLESGRLPANTALITFDDGYRECRDVAAPILARYGVPGVFFIPTSFISERRLYWWDRIDYLVDAASVGAIRLEYPYPLTLALGDRIRAKRFLHRVVKNVAEMDLERFLVELAERAGVDWTPELEAKLVERLVMTWDDIRGLRDAGMDIQSHTRTHRPLHTLSREALAQDLGGAKADLERELQTEIRAISYPVGRRVAHRDHLRRALMDAGYRLGFTNGSGINRDTRQLDRFDLRRMAVDRDTSVPEFKAMLALPGLAYVSHHNR